MSSDGRVSARNPPVTRLARPVWPEQHGRAAVDHRRRQRTAAPRTRRIISEANPRSTPIVVSQDRGFRELYVKATVSAHAGTHELKTGGDFSDVVRLPVPASRGHFFEAGLSKSLAGRLRLDASLFTRRMTDVADDDLLLNTGVSLRCRVQPGEEFACRPRSASDKPVRRHQLRRSVLRHRAGAATKRRRAATLRFSLILIPNHESLILESSNPDSPIH